jgi:FkbM family methyltransferase
LNNARKTPTERVSAAGRRLLRALYVRAGRLVANRQLVERFAVARAANKAILSVLRPEIIAVGDHKMYVDDKDSLRLVVKGIYEPFETTLVASEVREGDVVLDVGANIGYFTLIFARVVGPRGRVLAFEPDPANFAILERNITLNDYHNVTAIPLALSDTAGPVALYMSEFNRAHHRIVASTDAIGTIAVDSTTLDQYLESYDGAVDFIKIDVEGAEAMALRGMRGVIRRTQPHSILIEFTPSALAEAGDDPASLLNELTGAGYELFEIPRHADAMIPSSAAELLRKYPGDTDAFANLLCRKTLGD